VVYCPTEQMLADFFTKPLQGNLFRRLKRVVMGHAHIDSLKSIPTATAQERVGESTVLDCGSDARQGCTDMDPLPAVLIKDCAVVYPVPAVPITRKVSIGAKIDGTTYRNNLRPGTTNEKSYAQALKLGRRFSTSIARPGSRVLVL
jgi:hypothetical protein